MPRLPVFTRNRGDPLRFVKSRLWRTAPACRQQSVGEALSLDHRGWKAAPTRTRWRLQFTVGRFTVGKEPQVQSCSGSRFTVGKAYASVEPPNPEPWTL